MINESYNFGDNLMFTADYLSDNIVFEIIRMLQCKKCNLQRIYRRQLKTEIETECYLNDCLYSLARLDNIVDSYTNDSYNNYICDSHICFIKSKYFEGNSSKPNFQHWAREAYNRGILRKHYKCYPTTEVCVERVKQKRQDDAKEMKIKFKPNHTSRSIKHIPCAPTALPLKSCLKTKSNNTANVKCVSISENNKLIFLYAHLNAAKRYRKNLEYQSETVRRIMEEQENID